MTVKTDVTHVIGRTLVVLASHNEKPRIKVVSCVFTLNSVRSNMICCEDRADVVEPPPRHQLKYTQTQTFPAGVSVVRVECRFALPTNTGLSLTGASFVR